MIDPILKTVTIPAGETVPVKLHKDARFTTTTIVVKVGTSGILSFRGKAIDGQYETPEAPNTLDIGVRKLIYFGGIALEEIEVANGGPASVKLVIGQKAA